MEGAGGPIRGALARLRSAPLWVWITILLTFGLLVFAYLQYRKNSANGTSSTTSTSAGLGTVPSDGTGQPLWNTADTSGMVSGNPAELAAILAYLQSLQTPNAPTTASPNPPVLTRPVPTFPILKPAPQAPVRTGTGAINPPGTGYLKVRPVLWGVVGK